MMCLYTGLLTTLAGICADGLGTAASFKNPSGVSVDSNGAVYVADNMNHRIRKITSSGVYGGLGSHITYELYTLCRSALDEP